MYSTVFGGIVTDPALMVIPIDDHMVHRGDGVFEVFKCVHGRIFNLNAHFARLRHAAAAVRLRLPMPMPEIRRRVLATIRAGGQHNCTVHLYVSRGPGSLGVNPHDCPRSEVYIMVTRLKRPFMEEHPGGAVLRSSRIPPKPPFYAAIKCCNYLPNVLMKMEAEDWGVDFVVGFDAAGIMTEGATENVGLVTRGRRLLFPRLDGVLSGTTMLRVAVLARRLVKSGALAGVSFVDIRRDQLRRAREILVVGTTPNVASVVRFDGRPVADGKPGVIATQLNALLTDDICNNPRVQTRVF